MNELLIKAAAKMVIEKAAEEIDDESLKLATKVLSSDIPWGENNIPSDGKEIFKIDEPWGKVEKNNSTDKQSTDLFSPDEPWHTDNIPPNKTEVFTFEPWHTDNIPPNKTEVFTFEAWHTDNIPPNKTEVFTFEALQEGGIEETKDNGVITVKDSSEHYSFNLENDSVIKEQNSSKDYEFTLSDDEYSNNSSNLTEIKDRLTNTPSPASFDSPINKVNTNGLDSLSEINKSVIEAKDLNLEDLKKVKNGELQPNTIYRMEDGTTYETDDSGRKLKVTFKPKLTDDIRTAEDRKNTQEVGKQGIKGDEGGHIQAHSLGGTSEKINLFPQNANFNRGAYKKIENGIRNDLTEGKSVQVTVEFTYNDDTSRPEKVTVTKTVTDAHGNKETISITQKNASQENQNA